tara:strand:+ start:3490 stop:3918 length:429 start_codon:yes stop_codon:yes gene_type:complete
MDIETPYVATTNGIQVKVAPVFDEERSLIDQNVFIFLYAVEFTNNNEIPVQLMHRHWIIRNGRNEEKLIEGAGVIGEQPVILPSQTFHYSSQCPLDTPTGSMRGHYTFRYRSGEEFTVNIPPFFLRLQDILSNINGIYNPIN